MRQRLTMYPLAQNSINKQLFYAAVRCTALKRLRQLKEAARAVQKEKKRNLQCYHNRIPMYTNPHYASQKINLLLRGHLERFGIETQLTIIQFERLAVWLYENTTLRESGFLTLKANIYWELNIERVSAFFHQVLAAFLALVERSITMYKEEDNPVEAPQIRSEVGKMYPFFKDCVGAIDGTLVFVSVKDEDRKREGQEGAYHCRKGFLATNTFSCVDFNMNFKLVFPGWEGTAHDATVFNDARCQGIFRTPQGKFWLADAGYTQAEGYGGMVLAPYMSVRYPL
ncbi:hypothetical protein GcM1_211063 [Golovinomyces cichoracearum]|uniref:DDE Tnp4 domain-containing protein n=1 Tax=Golovinomyces cichoracearum TaxID=62708 RepID=A0A420IVE9_9PEZI|nr:hypothetical protein GcM1_211063 [Golovinomyces cichoracearum]